ncbi:MAG TPA: PhnD/SsuA/transferrin family substrate-binding protein [Aggregatilineales bacterium]|nr:PhnD/SsuA/transferrin family substrate-binding protein [Aggregatilineales bacterium]
MPLAVLALSVLVLTACGGRQATPPPTPLPAPTNTPRFTPLPPVPSQAPYGSADRPYQIVILPPPDSNVDPASLEGFLKDHTGLNFKEITASSDADLVDTLCGSVPTFAWVDGWTLLAAQAKGCGNVTLQIKQGAATGVKSDLIVSPAAAIDTLAALRARATTRTFCRLNRSDVVSWVLPVIMLRTTGFDPFLAFHTVKDYSDPNAMVSDVSDNACVAAIPSGTLATYKIPNVSDVTKTVKVLATSPELPFGGLMTSLTVPRNDSDTISDLFRNNLDALQGLVTADSLAPATNADFTQNHTDFSNLGINFAVLGP